MSYLPNVQYQALYAKYLRHRSADELIDVAGKVRGKVVWDLCCGGGEMAFSCFMQGAARIFAVDSCEKMMGEFLTQQFNPPKVTRCTMSIEDFLGDDSKRDPEPDIVLCRQAVNYWLNEQTVKDLAARMPKGSVFVFNTFNRKPGKTPHVKSYSFEGHDFVEVSWCLGNYVLHVQIRDGMEPHMTSFWWISPEDFRELLGEWFSIKKTDDGHTSIYKCVRK